MEKEPVKSSAALLLDLKKLVDEELGNLKKESVGRAFSPITDGLGLQSPRKKENLFLDNIPVIEPPKPTVEKPLKKPTLERAEDSPKPTLKIPIARPESNHNSLTNIMAEAPRPAAPKNPPPLPRPSLVRTLCAIAADEVFVLSLLALSLVITGKVLQGTGTYVPAAATGSWFHTPLFLQFALLEFVSIWLLYFFLCFGVLDLTFGMWVWGFSVSYGGANQKGKAWKKLKRILFSFLFYAPILPLFLLVLRRKSRNVLDVLSGTSLQASPI